MRIWAIVSSNNWNQTWRSRGPFLVRWKDAPATDLIVIWEHDTQRWSHVWLPYEPKDIIYSFPETKAEALDLLYQQQVTRSF